MLWRTSRSRANRRVLVHGLPYFGKLFIELMNGNGWEFQFFPDEGFSNLSKMLLNLRACDIVYQIGGRITLGKFLTAAKLLDKNRVVMHWVGSDTQDELPFVVAGKAAPWVVQRLFHWAETKWLLREVEVLGPTCELMPLPGARFPGKVASLPANFSVLVYMPGAHVGRLYGLDSILQVARELPQIPFEMVGFKQGAIADAPKNLRVHNHVSDLTEFYRNATVVWRPILHDGLSFMVLEALAHGRHVIWSYEFPGCIHANSPERACEEITKLFELHARNSLKLNQAGLQVIAENYLPSVVKPKILGRLEEILES